MTVDRNAAQEIAQKRHLAAVAPPGQREATAAELQERARKGNAAYSLKADPRWAWYAAILAEQLGKVEEELQAWTESDSAISPLEFNDAVMAYQKAIRAVAIERRNFLRWALRLVDDAIAVRDAAEAELARLRPKAGGEEKP